MPNTIRIQFPDESEWPGWHVPEYVLHSSMSAPLDNFTQLESSPCLRQLTLTVDSEACTDYSIDSPVFRATIRDGNSAGLKVSSSQSTPFAFALKFAFRDDLVHDLAHEAEVYEGALRSLQGVSIPRFYGLFTGVGVGDSELDSEGGQQIACLVLEFWGQSLRKPFRTLSMDVRTRIFERLCDLHRCGLHHGDFAERNVLMQGNDVRLIDFDRSEYHDCDCDSDLAATFKLELRPGGKLPDASEFGCPVLWEICRSNMQIWG